MYPISFIIVVFLTKYNIHLDNFVRGNWPSFENGKGVSDLNPSLQPNIWDSKQSRIGCKFWKCLSTLPISLNRGFLTSWISIYIERSQTTLSIDATISIILLYREGGREGLNSSNSTSILYCILISLSNAKPATNIQNYIHHF